MVGPEVALMPDGYFAFGEGIKDILIRIRHLFRDIWEQITEA